MACFFVSGAPSGIRLRAGTPKWRPAQARALAVLPALTVLRPAGTGLRAQPRDGMEHTADLEAARRLMDFGLQKDALGRRSEGHQGRVQHDTLEQREGRLDLGLRHRSKAGHGATIAGLPGRAQGR